MKCNTNGMRLELDLRQERKEHTRRDVAIAASAGGFASPGARAALALLVPLLVLLVLTLHAPAARATLYKWVDDQGVVHYTDKLPPEAMNKGNVELNKQGITVKKNDPPLSPEQRRAKEAEDERARQAAKERDEALRKDRALLQSYTTESEIDLAKTRALSTIDSQMQSAQAYTVTLNKRKQDITGRITALAGKPVPPALDRELASVDDELARQAELIATKRKEIVAVSARYDADKQRWHEIRTNAETASAAEAAANTAANPSKGGTVAAGAPGGTATPPIKK